MTPMLSRLASDKSKRSSAVANTVLALRRSILELGDGAYLGSEDQLLAKLGISRPTLRQAVRLLEHERLLVIKRGSGGGFYTRRPQIEAVAHAASIYLHIEHATPRDIFTASIPLVTEASRLAASSHDQDLRAALQRLLDASDAYEDGAQVSLDDAYAFDMEFIRIVSEMCGNPVIKLFVSIIYEFGSIDWLARMHKRHDESGASMHEARSQLIRTILAGDVELALIYSRRRAELAYKLVSDN